MQQARLYVGRGDHRQQRRSAAAAARARQRKYGHRVVRVVAMGHEAFCDVQALRVQRQLRPQRVEHPLLELRLVQERAFEGLVPMFFAARIDHPQRESQSTLFAAQRPCEQVVGPEHLRLFSQGQAGQRRIHGAAGFCHANFGTCGKDRSKPLREMVGEVPGLLARVARLERQYRERRTLGRQGTALAAGKQRHAQRKISQGRADDASFPELFIERLQPHSAISLLISGRRA